jgi:hypothetical protein
MAALPAGEDAAATIEAAAKRRLMRRQREKIDAR